MAITLESLATIKQTIVGFFRSGGFSGWDLSDTGFLGKIAGVLSLAALSWQRDVRKVDQDACPSSTTSTTGRENWAYVLGLDNRASGYGRGVAVAATGGAGTITGAAGTFYAAGSTLTGSDGVTVFDLDSDVTLPGGGSASGAFSAVTTGEAGNLDAAEVLTWVSPPAGSDATVTLTTGLSGGEDQESAAAVLVRILDRLQRPPKGGALVDYRTWAESRAVVYKAYPYRWRNGDGTVDVVLTASGTGAVRASLITAAVITDVQDYLDDERPVTCAGRRVLAARTAASGLALRVRITPVTAFDWIDTAAAYTVDAYSGAGPITLDLNTTAPTSLTDAITAGSKPRLQLICTGAPLPVQVRCTGHALIAGPKSRLTLEALPSTAPTPGDAVWAGGDAVAQIASDILDHVDGLGPSRQSGYADPSDVWYDTLYVSQLSRVALDAVSSTTEEALAKAVTSATINAVATDRQATDILSTAPELLYAASIAVTQ